MNDDQAIGARNALDVLAVLTETRPGNVRLNALDVLTRALKVASAEAKALADVRTLDDWAKANPDDTLSPRFRGEPFAPPEQQWEGFVAGEWEFFPSADAARAATAAWLRNEKKIA